MKRLLYVIIGILSLSANAQDRALLIGISNYQEETGWSKIHSHNDIALLQQVLPNTCKITTLCDSEATYQGIINAIEQLIKEIHPGEQILFHFSGHGQQMLTNDPNEPDLLDEALIPYDAPMIRTSTYGGERHLIDNQLDSLVTLLRTKSGVKGLVVVSIDACHSGGTHREPRSNDLENEEKHARCAKNPFDIFGLNTISSDSAKTIFLHLAETEQPILSNSNNTADIVYLSACQPYQVSYEVKENGFFYGPLTYAISRAYSSYTLSSIKNWISTIKEYYKQKRIDQKPYIINTLN